MDGTCEEKAKLPLPRFIEDGEVMPPRPDSDRLPAMYRPTEVSTWLGMSTDKLAKAREAGDGPAFVVLDGTVLYPEDELLAWAQATRMKALPRELKRRGGDGDRAA